MEGQVHSAPLENDKANILSMTSPIHVDLCWSGDCDGSSSKAEPESDPPELSSESELLDYSCESYEGNCPLFYMGLDARKSVFRGLRTTQAQTSLPIHAD